MSGRQCNYCILQMLKESAEKEDMKVETKPKDGGVDVFLNGVWICWFMELSDECAC